MQLKLGGKFHLRLNIGERPIANKYREGKMKSTLERELTVREIVKRETIEVSLVAFRSTARCIRIATGQHQFLVSDKGIGNVAISVVL
jgi:hypothetical protein